MSQDNPNTLSMLKGLTVGIVMVTAVLTTLLTLSVVYWWTRLRVIFSTFPESDCLTLKKQSICFFNNSMTSDGMIAVLSSFYTNLIVILIGILTLIGIIAALSLRYSAKQQVEAELPAITKGFFANNSGRKLLIGLISEETGEIRGNIDTLLSRADEHSEFIAGFSERLEKLEYLIEELDTGEIVTEPINQNNQHREERDGV